MQELILKMINKKHLQNRLIMLIFIVLPIN